MITALVDTSARMEEAGPLLPQDTGMHSMWLQCLAPDCISFRHCNAVKQGRDADAMTRHLRKRIRDSLRTRQEMIPMLNDEIYMWDLLD